MEPNQQPQQKSNGALIGSIIIIVILIIGGIYLWQNSKKERTLPENSYLASPSPEEDIANGAAAIEAELDNMDLDIDSEI